MRSEKIVLKLGGSITTYKNVSSFPLDAKEIERTASKYIRSDVIRRLLEELKSFIEENKIKFFLVLGVGPFGHFIVKHWDRVKNSSVPRKSLSIFIKKMKEHFDSVGLSVDIHAPHETVTWNGKSFQTDKLFNRMKKSLEKNLIPLTYGDMVPASNGTYNGYEVFSGDTSSVELAIKWKAKKIIMVMDEEGLYDKDPKLHKEAKFIPLVHSNENLNILDEGIGVDVTGRIKGKIEKLQKAAKHGIKSQLINGLKKGYLRRALLGDESIGTLIVP